MKPKKIIKDSNTGVVRFSPNSDFSIPTNYICIPRGLGHLNEDWSMMPIPQTPEEIDIEIALEKQRYLDDMQFFAKSSGKTDPAVNIELIIHTAQQQAKRIGELYERRGELKFNKGITDIRSEIAKRDLEQAKRFNCIRDYLKKLSAWKASKGETPRPRAPKLLSGIRISLVEKWQEYRNSVKGVHQPTADDFYQSHFFTDPIQEDGSSLALYIHSVKEIQALLHTHSQNQRNIATREKRKAKQKQKRGTK